MKQPRNTRRQALGCLIVLAFFLGLGLLRQIPDLLDPEAAAERRRVELKRLADEESARILRMEQELREQKALQTSLKIRRGAAGSVLHWENSSDVTFTGVTLFVYPSRAAYEQSGVDALFGGPLAPHRSRRLFEIPPGSNEFDLSVLVKDGRAFAPRVDPVGVVSLNCDQGSLTVGFQ